MNESDIHKIVEQYKINIDEESEIFLSVFLKTYKEKIQQMSSSIENISDIEEAFNKITPDKIKLKVLKSINKTLKNNINVDIFLNAITTGVITEIIKMVIKCVNKFQQDEINGSSIIYTFVNNKDLSRLSNMLDITTPIESSLNDDITTKEELIEELKDKYKGIEKFPKKFMLILASNQVKKESKIIKNFIIYSKKIDSQDDYKLEISKKYIKYLFPDKKLMSLSDITAFKINKTLRKNIVTCTLRMLLFYGFIIDKKDTVIQINENGKNIGLYSVGNYNVITQIMNFLVDVDMEYLSAIFFLAMCKAIKSDNYMYKVIDNKYIKDWIKTQPYLKDYKTPTKFLKKNECDITGLDYNGNSCYMDSALVCTFAIPNKTITDNILNKNLDILKDTTRLFSVCNKNLKDDIKIRKDIQKALNDITNSIRLGDKKIKNCSNLRSIIKKCPGSQPFHGTTTQDSGEFLTYLFNMFQVDVASTSRKTYGSNDLGMSPEWKLFTKQIDNKASPILDVVSTALLRVKDDYDITDFIKQTEYSNLDESNRWMPDKNNPGTAYTLKKEVYKLKSSPIVIFNLTRKYGSPVYDKKGKFKSIKTLNVWKKVTAPEKFNLNDKTLYLTGIVVHTGGAHYIANFKCNGEWYWYDDNPNSSKHIINHTGSYEKMLKTKPSPLSHGTLFFYTHTQTSIITQSTKVNLTDHGIEQLGYNGEIKHDDVIIDEYIKCNPGLVTEEKYDVSSLYSDIGEFNDVYCVAKGDKPLAALDFSYYGINKFRKLNIDKINKVIKFANSKGVQALHNKKTGGLYLKTIFFLPHNYDNSLKLMKILWDNEGMTNEEIQYMIGKLLGYTINNIKYFIKKNYNIIITDEQIKIFQDKLDNMKTTLNELQKNNQIIKIDNIKYI
jgi:ubiquitin C-terminal hydrolase